MLEHKPHIGGASVTEEFAPGYRASTYSFIMGHPHPRVIAELDLRKHGLESIPVPDVCNPTEDDRIVFSKDPKKTHAQIARFSRRDVDNYPRFFEYLQSTVKLLREVQMLTPTNPFRRDPAGLFKTARLAWKLRNYEQEIYTLMQTLSLSAFNYVSRWFESDIVKAKFMFWATIGSNVGPYSPGTAFYLVAHLIGQTGLSFAKGGMGAIAGAGKAHGMRIRTAADVAESLVSNGWAHGVRLTDGEEIPAGIVKRDQLPAEFMRWIDGYRTRGKSFKLLCAIDRLPRYKGFSSERTGDE